jgi:hypothetical protein
MHTPGSPSPSGRDASICRSGRSVGSLAFQLNNTLPTVAPSLPGTASRTSWKPEPAGLRNIGLPPAIPSAAVVVPSAPARARVTMAGPSDGVGVGVGSSRIDWSMLTTSAAVIDPSRLPSAGQSPSSGPSPNSRASRAASWTAVPSHCACAREPIEAIELRPHMTTIPMSHFGRRAVVILGPGKPRHYADTPCERQCKSGTAVQLSTYCQGRRRVVKNLSQKEEVCTWRRNDRSAGEHRRIRCCHGCRAT